MSVSDAQNHGNAVGILAFIAVGILLNFGLFFILSILAPVTAGFVSGYLINEYRIAALSGFLSATVAYSIIFVVTAAMTTDILIIASAVLIMGVLGAAGGALGVILHSVNRTRMN
ncbi:MAG: hypothetical protein C4K48_07330 [Candidatus Thorarchaeota archaeon]|nr:MAG: hypothetical protein C4K48_07330 [Candidatus Thorarchaeota archaeon]